MKSASPLSREEKARISVEMYLTGMSTRDIQAKVKIGRSSVLLYLKEAGIERDAGKRISAKMTGRPGNRRGVKMSDSTKAKISAAAIGNKRCIGRVLSPDSIEKNRQSNIIAHPKNPPKQKPEFVGPRRPRGKWVHPDEKIALDHVRAAAKRMLRRVLTMARVRKNLPTENLLGYSKDELRRHLESQFRDGVSWEKRDSFHIDHITPVAYFFKKGIRDPAIINALSNLQVLTPQENFSKSDRLITDAGVKPGIVELTA
jgi:hypothetical protein